MGGLTDCLVSTLNSTCHLLSLCPLTLLHLPGAANDKKKGPKKRRSKTKSSSQSSVDTEYQPSPPRRSSRRSRSKARVEGSTNDNAITIDDSSSDESSIVEAASVTDVEASEVEPLSQVCMAATN